MPIGLNGKKMNGVDLLETLNKLGGENGIGRADILENRLVGMKSHGVYETPGGTILYEALKELRMMCLDKDSIRIINDISGVYADLIYNGKYFTNVRRSMEVFIREMMKYASGSIKLVLYKGNVIVGARSSKYSLYNQDIASFTTGATYSHKDATGFINLFGLQVGIESKVHKE
jgi:argininosuccinate synthase